MNYWEKRFLKDKASAVNAAEKYILRTQEKYFKEARKEIEAAVEKLYRTFADSEKITLAEAKRRISDADFSKIDFESLSADQILRNREYRKKMKTLPADAAAAVEKQHARYESQLAAYTKKGEITHLSLMQANIDKALLDLYDKNQASMYDMLAAEYEDGYYRAVYRNQQAVGFGKDLAALNRRAVEKAVMAEHNKSAYSKTLYEHCSHFSEDLKQNLVIGLIRGESMDRMASRMRKRLSVSASAARRLVRTETAYIYESATMDAYKECGIEQYEYLATLDGKTSEVCRELDGKVFRVKDAIPGKNYPPMHPNCRSTTVCHFADDKVTSRIAKGEGGKYYEVPSDMTYKEWMQNHGKPELLLTNDEKRAINQYTGFLAYRLNNKLRKGAALTAAEQQLKEQLDKALDKMPAYEGNLVRCLDLSNVEDRKNFLEQHQIGEKVEYHEFISASKKEGYSETADTFIYINNAHNGRDISTFNPEENEVLYKSGSKFIVKNIVERNDGIYVLMEEVNG